jgi:hypothetical protein
MLKGHQFWVSGLWPALGTEVGIMTVPIWAVKWVFVHTGAYSLMGWIVYGEVTVFLYCSGYWGYSTKHNIQKSSPLRTNILVGKPCKQRNSRAYLIVLSGKENKCNRWGVCNAKWGSRKRALWAKGRASSKALSQDGGARRVTRLVGPSKGLVRRLDKCGHINSPCPQGTYSVTGKTLINFTVINWLQWWWKRQKLFGVQIFLESSEELTLYFSSSGRDGTAYCLTLTLWRLVKQSMNRQMAVC